MKPYYEEDGIRIFHGDCRETLPQLEYVDSVLTDPPYFRDVYLRASAPNTKFGSGTPARLGNGLKRLAAGEIGAVDEIFEDIAVEIGRLVKRWALVFSDVENCHKWRFALELAGMRYIRTGIWNKPDSMPQMSGDRPAVGFEPCTIAHAQATLRWNGGGSRGVWTHFISKGDERPDHPCPKPLSLMLELVRHFSDPDELIADPFMGSGTTLLAAKQCGRRAIGIEIEEKYCEIAAKRLSQKVFQFSNPLPSTAEDESQTV